MGGLLCMAVHPKIFRKTKWNIRIVRAKINSEKIELETSYEKSNEI